MANVPNTALLTQFAHAFTAATGAEVISMETDAKFSEPRTYHLDAVCVIKTANSRIDLLIVVLREAYPRDIREAVWQLETLQSRRGGGVDPQVPFIVAEQLSPGARRDLQNRKVGYFDSSGSLFFKHDRWLVNIDRPAPQAQTRRAHELFKGAREQVVHALLNDHSHAHTGSALALKSETSPFTVSQTMRELERLEWVRSAGAGPTLTRTLVQPGMLLDAWTLAWRTKKESPTLWYLFSERPGMLPTRLSKLFDERGLGQWALTGAIAANLKTPLLTTVDTADVIVPVGSTEKYAEAAGLQRVNRGGNVTIVERRGASMLFRHRASGTWLASNFIQYLDLQNGRGRNKELAEHFRETVLKI